MPKLVIDELDVKLSKRYITKLCKKYNISWLDYTNVNGGKYIECIVGYDYNLNQSKYIDIYYNCIANKILYRNDRKEALTKNNLSPIIEYFKLLNKED